MLYIVDGGMIVHYELGRISKETLVVLSRQTKITMRRRVETEG